MHIKQIVHLLLINSLFIFVNSLYLSSKSNHHLHVNNLLLKNFKHVKQCLKYHCQYSIRLMNDSNSLNYLNGVLTIQNTNLFTKFNFSLFNLNVDENQTTYLNEERGVGFLVNYLKFVEKNATRNLSLNESNLFDFIKIQMLPQQKCHIDYNTPLTEIHVKGSNLTNRTTKISCLFAREHGKLKHARRVKRSIDSIRFSKNFYLFKQAEKQPIDSLVGKLSVSFNELEHDLILEATKDSTSLNLFKLDKNLLELRTNAILNQSKHFLKLKLVKKDTKITLAATSIQINIIDTTIQKLKFKYDKYEVQMFENNAQDAFVIRINVDQDNYIGRVTYQLTTTVSNLSSSMLPFQIKPNSGDLYAKRQLDSQIKDLYIFNVIAFNEKRQNVSTQVYVKILPHLEDEQQSQMIRFEKNEYTLSLAENSDFQAILKVKALNSNQILYSLHGSLNDLNTFEIDAQTGQIKLVSKLNYDLKNSYKLNLIAKDLTQQPASYCHATLNINILDVNKQPPVFTAPFYEFLLFENAKTDSLVGKIQAYQAASTQQIQMTYLLNQNDSVHLPFYIDSKNGTIYLKEKLQPKNSIHNYEFYVRALNEKRMNQTSSLVKVKIKILDASDIVPEFSQLVYQINVNEEAQIGLPLLTLSLKQNYVKDYSDSQLEYSFEDGNELEVFSLIKQANQRIFLTLERAGLNYKKKSEYNLWIKVLDPLDGMYSMCNVKLNVMPNKNYGPRFNKDSYTFQISENASKGTLIGNISAISFYDSLDGLELTFNNQLKSQSTVVYKLIDSNSLIDNANLMNSFYLDDSTGRLFVSGQLDREKVDSYTLYVTAMDKYKPFKADHAIIQIQIMDTNDNIPQFTNNQQYEANIYNDTQKGDYILRVEALDKDLGQNGQVRYSIEFSGDENVDQLLSINSETGVIRLNRKSIPKSSVNLTLIASDLGDTMQLKSKTLLTLNCLNFNKSPPIYDQTIYEFSLIEDEQPGYLIGQLKARDPDQSNKISNIVYKILEDDRFELRPSGKFNKVNLILKKSLSVQQDQKFLNLTIRAHYATFKQYNDCFVKIKILSKMSVNVQIPKKFKIIFNNYKNYFITEQQARVPLNYDQIDPTSNLTFKIADKASIANQLIYLDEKTGQITLKSVLNSNNQINITFMINISNNGKLEATTQCQLVVLMLSDQMIDESVTLSLIGIDSDSFMHGNLYDQFVDTIWQLLKPKVKKSGIHLFNIIESNETYFQNDKPIYLNLSLSVSNDYEKESFISASLLKQAIHANLKQIEQTLHIFKVNIYDQADVVCSQEPCLNYQQCTRQVNFASASQDFAESTEIQFRSIATRQDFKCSCPDGFTGTNVSAMCDLEINLCYSNPCGNNGICVSLESSFVCICDANYTGRYCETNLNEQKCDSSINVCRSNSKCKNLILGGILCDGCLDKPDRSSTCELRTRNFPPNSDSYLVLPGMTSARLRFNIKLTFMTSKSNGVLLYNGRLESETQNDDFISLRVQNDYLVFSYSMGDQTVNEVKINHLRVNDGKWRTIAIEYSMHNFSISLDNDDFEEFNGCELNTYENKNQVENSNIKKCIRIKHSHVLPKKCSSQLEPCFRYFDLNGPLYLGVDIRYQKLESSYEGCLKDLYINERLIDLEQDVILDHKTKIGCPIKSTNQGLISTICQSSPCFNNATCVLNTPTKDTNSFKCECKPGFKGHLCQYEINKLVRTSLMSLKTCPAKWWGNLGICGPCKCDVTKNFSPDCNKTTGECLCKPKYYRKINKHTKEATCVPCDCHLEGSSSLQCDHQTGQCPCLKGAGITGRRCDQCVSPLAEMIPKINECRHLSSNDCPKSFKANIWWPRTPFNTKANTTCPQGSIGYAYRTCGDQGTSGWLNDIDLSECKSLNIIESQLLKWSLELSLNKSQLNSYQAFKLVDEMNKIVSNAEQIDQDSQDENDGFKDNLAMNAFDFIVLRNITKNVIDFEVENGQPSMYMQDKHFLKNIFNIINGLLNPNYEVKIFKLNNNSLNQGGEVFDKFDLTDLTLTLDKYLASIVHHQLEELTLNSQLSSGEEKNVEISFENFDFFLKKSNKLTNQLAGVKYKFISETDNAINKCGFMSMNIESSHLPKRLLSSYSNKKQHVLTNQYFEAVTNVFVASWSLLNQTKSALVVEFDLKSIYKTPINTDYKCVRLDKNLKYWSSKNSKLIQQDSSKSQVKCSFDILSNDASDVFTVITTSNYLSKQDANMIEFTIVFKLFMSISLAVLFLTILCLMSLVLRYKLKTALTCVHLNLLLNHFLVQFTFFVFVNFDEFKITCKLIALVQHYLNISSYLWLFLVSLHLYRMLTELRDINKQGSKSPLFYYIIAYVTPTIIIALCLGLKQDIYGSIESMNSTLLCWLSLTSISDLFIVYLSPLIILVMSFLILTFLSLKETRKQTFKQTDVSLVHKSLIESLLILPMLVLTTSFLIMFVNQQDSYLKLVYQHLYLSFSFMFSLLLFFLFVLLNKNTKKSLIQLIKSSKKTKLKQPDDNLAFTIEKKVDLNYSTNVIDVNKQLIKYGHHFINFNQHSMSTTTTSGTMDVLNDDDDTNSQSDSEYLKQTTTCNGVYTSSSNGYLSHMANTTNTEASSTVNESSEFNYQIEFNKPLGRNDMNIKDCDMIDVGKILKTRNLAMIHQQQQQDTGQKYYNVADVNFMMNNNNQHHTYINNDNNVALAAAQANKAAVLKNFWPSTVAECDTSFLEGSVVYTPTKLPYLKQENLSSQKSAEMLITKQNSYVKSNLVSNVSQGLFVTSPTNTNQSAHLVPISNHTGSVTTSEMDESGNETRV